MHVTNHRDYSMRREPALLHVVLIKPEIHPNTGNIARLCAANELPLHLVGTPGFRLDDRAVRRAGLDYWPYVDLRQVADMEELQRSLRMSRFWVFSARADRAYTEVSYAPGDCLVFGPESTGLPDDLLQEHAASCVRIPMRSKHVRSLNLATAVGIGVYEALRQLGLNDQRLRTTF